MFWAQCSVFTLLYLFHTCTAVSANTCKCGSSYNLLNHCVALASPNLPYKTTNDHVYSSSSFMHGDLAMEVLVPYGNLHITHATEVRLSYFTTDATALHGDVNQIESQMKCS